MSYVVEKPLPTNKEVLEKLPLGDNLTQKVIQDQEEIKAIIEGRDPRKIMIIGPCSAWPDAAVLEYAEKLKPIAEKVSDKLKIIMRVYLQKPRTTVGWLGPVNQPDPFEAPDLESGTYYCRSMMIEAVRKGYAIADEALFTHNDNYFVDLLSWIAIGARSAEDQEHRIFASMIPHPVGLKNPTSGNIDIGVNSVIAAQHGHVFAFHGKQIRTSGNPHAHLILRGGNGTSNHDYQSLLEASEKLHAKMVKNPSIIVDASHDNSICSVSGQKDPLKQPEILKEIIESMNRNDLIKSTVKGFMVESFLVDGKQSADKASGKEELEYGKSITDGCLGMQRTEEMLLEITNKI